MYPKPHSKPKQLTSIIHNIHSSPPKNTQLAFLDLLKFKSTSHTHSLRASLSITNDVYVHVCVYVIIKGHRIHSAGLLVDRHFRVCGLHVTLRSPYSRRVNLNII